MNKIFKNILGIIVSFGILFSIFAINISAAGAVIAFSKKNLTIGEKVEVKITLNAEEAMYGVACVIQYDNNVINYTTGNAIGGAGSVEITESPSGETSVSYTLTFTAIAAGSCTISAVDCRYEGLVDEGSAKQLSGASATLTVNDVTLSSNANLSALSLSAGTLSPKFNAATTSYTVTVKNSVTSCNVYATAADSGAKVEVSGEAALKIGKNTRTVTVTAPSGAQKTYTITINRSEEEEITSSDASSSEEENNYTANIEGVDYTVATDISGVELFKGFTASTAQYNSVEVAVAVDANNEYKLYYLKAPDSDVLTPYSYDEENMIFTKLAYFTQGENTYIYSDIPTDITLAEDFYTTTATIGGNDVKCYANNASSFSDFYYLYCYSNGEYGFYRYDALENVMQRYPEMETLALEQPEQDGDEEAKEGFFARFASLSGNAKIIVIAIPLLILSGIALLVLLIIKFVKNKELDKYYDDDDDLIDENVFDSVAFNNFSINDEPTDLEAEATEEATFETAEVETDTIEESETAED